MIRPIDKKLYCYKGTWQDPHNDEPTVFFYYINSPMTLLAKYNGNIESVGSSMSIIVAGEHRFAIGDTVSLETEQGELRIMKMTVNFVQRNMAVRDLLKPRVQDIMLELE